MSETDSPKPAPQEWPALVRTKEFSKKIEEQKNEYRSTSPASRKKRRQ